MRITKVGVQAFRAFDEHFELDLKDGKNLLLHGENGAGKSSLYIALKRFFEERGDSVANHRNCFSPAGRGTEVRLHFEGVDSGGGGVDDDVTWSQADGHPLAVPTVQGAPHVPPALRSTLVDGARRAGFLDYRVMLRTNLLTAPLPRSNRGPTFHDQVFDRPTEGLGAQLFDLVSMALLAGVRVPRSGGTETTIGALVREVWRRRPASRHRRRIDLANRAADEFNQAFNGILPQVEAKLAELLAHFSHLFLNVTFQPVSLGWDTPSLELKGAELVPDITFRGVPLRDHHLILNEARLSALGLCLFFVGVLLADNDYSNPAQPRFLVLDDALIGLELQNRLPVLRILGSDAFKNYQVLLFTHDRVWYDLARGHLTEKAGWIHSELIADEDTGFLIPLQKAARDDLQMAELHYRNGDLKAAAVYARSAFEWKLRNVCESRGIKLAFKPNPDQVSAGIMWDGLVARQREREGERANGAVKPDLIPADLEQDVATMRSTVLNRLSHTGSSGLVKAEVAAAIATVATVIAHDFPKS